LAWRGRLLVPAAVLVGLGLHLWAAWHWQGNFTSDEAVIGLMARHVRTGHVPVYMYGQGYLGSLDALFGAASMGALGLSVPALRLPAILLFGVWLWLFAALVRRWFGQGAAVVSTLAVAISSLWITVPSILVIPLGAMSLAGTAALLWALPAARFSTGLSDRPGASPRETAPSSNRSVGQGGRLRRWFGVGLAAGLALWLYPPAALYVPPLALTVAYRRDRRLRGAWLALPGLIAGTAPMWAGWFVLGERTRWPVAAADPAGIPRRALLLVSEVLPALWGAQPIAYLPRLDLGRAALSVAMLALSVAAVLWFLWTRRRVLKAIFTFSRVDEGRVGSLLVILLFGVPALATLLSGNVFSTFNLLITRYLVVAWQAEAVMLGVFIAAIARRSRVAAGALLVVWLAQAGVGQVLPMYRAWREHAPCTPQDVQALEAVLEREGVSGGYADYWEAYALDFLTDERLTICPYNGKTRYVPYEEAVLRAPRRAYLLRPGQVEPGTTRLADLVQALESGGDAGQGFVRIRSDAAAQVVRMRETVGPWDVWVLEKRCQEPFSQKVSGTFSGQGS
jgi:hypothetical protein